MCPNCPNLNATDMTQETLFERLYLVSGLFMFELGVNCLCAFTPPPFIVQLFLDFCKIVFHKRPLIFFLSTIRKSSKFPVQYQSLVVETSSRKNWRLSN